MAKVIKVIRIDTPNDLIPVLLTYGYDIGVLEKTYYGPDEKGVQIWAVKDTALFEPLNLIPILSSAMSAAPETSSLVPTFVPFETLLADTHEEAIEVLSALFPEYTILDAGSSTQVVLGYKKDEE